MLCASIYRMKWSDNSCSVWRTRSSSSFSMTKRVVGVIAVAVPIRTVWPAMHPSPKKSVGPNIATTASFPDPFTTENFTPPFWTYMTLSAPSPCEKIDSFLRYSAILRDTPAVSRNTCGSKMFARPFVLLFVLRSCAFIFKPKRPRSRRFRSPSRRYQKEPAQNCAKQDSAPRCHPLRLLQRLREGTTLAGTRAGTGRILPLAVSFFPISKVRFPSHHEPIEFLPIPVPESPNVSQHYVCNHFHQEKRTFASGLGARDSSVFTGMASRSESRWARRVSQNRRCPVELLLSGWRDQRNGHWPQWTSNDAESCQTHSGKTARPEL